MDNNRPQLSDVDLEKGIALNEDIACAPTSQSTLRCSGENPIVIEEDSDEGSVHAPEIDTRAVKFLRAVVPKIFLKPTPKPLRIITRKVEKCDEGYPYLAAFLDSDENFMIYRRFGFLHARLLLQKQDELRIMEEKLDEMDRKDRLSNCRAIQCRIEDLERKDQAGESRQALLTRIEETILKYDSLLLNAQQLAAANRPPRRDYNSVANFIAYKKPLLEGDDDFIYHKEDLVTLRPGRESAWLDAAVEKFLKIFPRPAVKYVFCSKETAAKTEDDDLFLPTKARVDRLVSFLIMTAVLALLVLPVYALYHVGSSFTTENAQKSNAICMGILLVATLLFSAALALFTKAKRHELLGAAAAYCAILVVFIANLGFNSPS